MAIVINGSTGISATESSSVLGDGVVESADIADSAVTAGKLASGAAVSNIGYTPANIQAQNIHFRNRIINGDMRIDQRNSGASTSVQNNSYPSVDRWYWQNVLGSSITATAQQNAGSVTPPAGFTNYLGLTSGGAFSPAADDVFVWKQTVEGYNVSDLAWGTADAKPIAISFWVRSSLTGTFSGAVAGLTGGTSSWVFTYTISSSNTWEYKTIYVDGNTTTTLGSTTNGGGLQLRFCVSIGSGTTYGTSTVNQWTSGNKFGATGSTNVLGTSGATFYITGVQLEVGSVATEFERRPYGTELALCQRYHEVLGWPSAAGTAMTIGSYSNYPGGSAGSWYFKVSKRATPTITFNGAGNCTSQSANQDMTNCWNGATPSYLNIATGSSASAEL